MEKYLEERKKTAEANQASQQNLPSSFFRPKVIGQKTRPKEYGFYRILRVVTGLIEFFSENAAEDQPRGYIPGSPTG